MLNFNANLVSFYIVENFHLIIFDNFRFTIFNLHLISIYNYISFSCINNHSTPTALSFILSRKSNKNATTTTWQSTSAKSVSLKASGNQARRNNCWAVSYPTNPSSLSSMLLCWSSQTIVSFIIQSEFIAMRPKWRSSDKNKEEAIFRKKKRLIRWTQSIPIK